MAKSEDSPTMFMGQAWSTWADRIEDLKVGKVEETLEMKKKKDCDAMKLRKEDMALFGYCPVQDEFYLVVCEQCGQVIKPQAFKSHTDMRHGGSAIFSKVSIAAVSEPQETPRERSPAPPDWSKSPTPPQTSRTGARNAVMSSDSAQSSPVPAEDKRYMLQNSSTRLKNNNKAMPVVKVERMTDLPPPTQKPNSSPPVPSPAIPTASLSPSPNIMSPTPPPLLSEISRLISTSETRELEVTMPPAIETIVVHPMAPPKPFPLPVKPVKKSRRLPGERKLQLCKDREFDPDKHCGVPWAETGEPCTRSLTCKTHALSQRRAVPGRSMPFDKLLMEHRESRDAALIAAGLPPASLKASSRAHLRKMEKKIHRPSPSTSATTKITMPTMPLATSATALSSNCPAQCYLPESPYRGYPRVLVDRLPGTTLLRTTRPTCSIRNLAEGLLDARKPGSSTRSTPYQHPKPIATCRFGARQMTNGFAVFDRKSDLLRSAFRSAMDRYVHPPPLKKMCVENPVPTSKEGIIASNELLANLMDQSSSTAPRTTPKIIRPVNLPRSVPTVNKVTPPIRVTPDVKVKPPEAPSAVGGLQIGTITIPLSAVSGPLSGVTSSGVTTATINLTPSTIAGAFNIGSTQLQSGTVNLTMTLLNKNVQIQTTRNNQTQQQQQQVHTIPAAVKEMQQPVKDLQLTISPVDLAALQGKGLAVTMPPVNSENSGYILTENGPQFVTSNVANSSSNVLVWSNPAPVSNRGGGAKRGRTTKAPKRGGGAGSMASSMPALAALMEAPIVTEPPAAQTTISTTRATTPFNVGTLTRQLGQQPVVSSAAVLNGFQSQSLAGGNIILKGAGAVNALHSMTNARANAPSPVPTCNLDASSTAISAHNMPNITFTKMPLEKTSPRQPAAPQQNQQLSQPQFINLNSTLTPPSSLSQNFQDLFSNQFLNATHVQAKPPPVSNPPPLATMHLKIPVVPHQGRAQMLQVANDKPDGTQVAPHV